jgi:hypothetical protein
MLLKPCGAQERVEVYRLDTTDYRIQMSVRFDLPYKGRQLTFRSRANPKQLLCYSGNGDSSTCLESFVGAAVVTYRSQPRRKQIAAAVTLREMVKVLAQSEGLDKRPTYIVRHGSQASLEDFGTFEGVFQEP